MNFYPDRGIADLSSKVIIVTGGNSDNSELGLETIQALAKHTCLPHRPIKKGETTAYKLHEFVLSIVSITAAVHKSKSSELCFGLLVNNAAILIMPERLTEERYEI